MASCPEYATSFSLNLDLCSFKAIFSLKLQIHCYLCCIAKMVAWKLRSKVPYYRFGLTAYADELSS